MSKALVMIHTVQVLPKPLGQTFAEAFPDLNLVHMLDESLLRETLREGAITPQVVRRLGRLAVSAEEFGADAVLVTCSSVSPAVDPVRPLVSIPVIKIDDAMCEEAVRLGTRIGIVATASTTLGPSSSLVREKARQVGKRVEVQTACSTEAFAALAAGDLDKHDQILKGLVAQMAGEVDVIMLAQASMARLAPLLGKTPVPVLTSPPLAVDLLRRQLYAS
ncbi:MAG: aspartate/glutamate racemase family protein [Bacteroidota bacterium]